MATKGDLQATQSAAVAINKDEKNIKQLGLNICIPVTEWRQAEQIKPSVTHTGMFLHCFPKPLNHCCPHNLTWTGFSVWQNEFRVQPWNKCKPIILSFTHFISGVIVGGSMMAKCITMQYFSFSYLCTGIHGAPFQTKPTSILDIQPPTYLILGPIRLFFFPVSDPVKEEFPLGFPKQISVMVSGEHQPDMTTK